MGRHTALRRALTSGVAGAAALALAGTGSPALAASATPAARPAAAADRNGAATPAAGVLARLSSNLEENVYLQTITLEKVEQLGAKAPVTKEAVKQLVASSSRVGGEIAGQGTKGQTAFTAAWLAHAGTLVTYGLAFNPTHPRPGVKAKAKAAYRAQEKPFGALVHKLLPSVPAAAVRKLIAAEDTLTLQAAAAVGAGAPTYPIRGEAAALGVYPLAIALAKPVAKVQHADGNPLSPGSVLRSAATVLFVGHVYQTGIASDAGFSFGIKSKQYAQAKLADDLNARIVSDVIKAIAGKAAAKQFLVNWRVHLSGYWMYVDGLAKHDAGMKAKGKAKALSFTRTESTLIHQLLPSLPQPAVQDILKMHVLGTLQIFDEQHAMKPVFLVHAHAGAVMFRQFAGAFAVAVVAGGRSDSAAAAATVALRSAA